MLGSLGELLGEANREGRALPCFNVFNLDFIHSIIAAAEEENSPVILALNGDMVDYYSLDTLVPLLLACAVRASVPVCPHLDHTYDPEVVRHALELGMPSVMYDGSQLPLKENLKAMNEIGLLTQKHRAGLEGEVGSVAYADGDPRKAHIRSEMTHPDDAVSMAEGSPLTALAVSVGNVHRLIGEKVEIDFDLLNEISTRVSIPLVIHGTSGIRPEIIRKIARETSVAKFNIATDLRKVWGETLRGALIEDGSLFDPLQCSRKIHLPLKERAQYWINLLR